MTVYIGLLCKIYFRDESLLLQGCMPFFFLIEKSFCISIMLGCQTIQWDALNLQTTNTVLRSLLNELLGI